MARSPPARPTCFGRRSRAAAAPASSTALGFDRGAQEGDHELEAHGVTVVVDPFSAPYLKGARSTSLDGLQESGFKIDNPNATSSCGCGHSFQVEDERRADAQAGGGCGSGCSH